MVAAKACFADYKCCSVKRQMQLAAVWASALCPTLWAGLARKLPSACCMPWVEAFLHLLPSRWLMIVLGESTGHSCAVQAHLLVPMLLSNSFSLPANSVSLSL